MIGCDGVEFTRLGLGQVHEHDARFVLEETDPARPGDLGPEGQFLVPAADLHDSFTGGNTATQHAHAPCGEIEHLAEIAGKRFLRETAVISARAIL